MFKSTFMAFVALLLCLSAQAGSYIRTHEDFVHLSEYEKNQLIIKTMELVVAIESQYNYEVRKFGYDSKRFEKFIKAVSKVKSLLFMDSAYAATSGKRPMTDWNSYGNAFKTLMAKDGSNCIFAGWPSKPYVLNGKTFCGHPDFIQGTTRTRHTDKPMADWTKSYPDPKENSGCGPHDQKRILCNPAIFGFKNAANKDLFCVDSPIGAENSAFHCMQEALKERSPEEGIDSKEVRLAALRGAFDSNKDAFKAVQEFAYKSCVCDTAPKNFNREYQAYIRKHRTCYGLMEMMSAVSCGSTLPIDTSIFTSFKNYTSSIKYNAGSENTTGSVVDHQYEQFIKNEVQVSAKDEYNLLCKGIAKPEVVVPPTTKTYECTKATCQSSVANGVTSYACSTFAIKDQATGEVARMDVDPQEKPTEAGQTALPIAGSIGGIAVSLSCPLEIKPPDAQPTDYTCSKANCTTIAPAEAGGQPTFQCQFTVHETGKTNVAAVFSTEPAEKPAQGAVQTEGARLPITGKIGTQDVSLSCPLTIVPLTPETVATAITYNCTKAECTAKAATTPASSVLAGSEEVATSTTSGFTCTLEAHDKAKPDVKIASLSGSPDAAPTNGNTSVFKVSIAGKEESLSCPVSIKVAKVPAKIEPTPAVTAPTQLSGPAQMNPGPPRPQMRGSSDTSAVGIK